MAQSVAPQRKGCERGQAGAEGFHRRIAKGMVDQLGPIVGVEMRGRWLSSRTEVASEQTRSFPRC